MLNETLIQLTNTDSDLCLYGINVLKVCVVFKYI